MTENSGHIQSIQKIIPRTGLTFINIINDCIVFYILTEHCRRIFGGFVLPEK